MEDETGQGWDGTRRHSVMWPPSPFPTPSHPHFPTPTPPQQPPTPLLLPAFSDIVCVFCFYFILGPGTGQDSERTMLTCGWHGHETGEKTDKQQGPGRDGTGQWTGQWCVCVFCSPCLPFPSQFSRHIPQCFMLAHTLHLFFPIAVILVL